MSEQQLTRVMLVDDHLLVRDGLNLLLSTFENVEVVGVAADGREALKILKDEWLDLVITDYNMPDMNGIELITEMKKDDELGAIPVIVVTTEGSLKKVEEFMKMGASGYVKKPFTPEIIREKLIQILGDMQDEESFENSDDGLDF